MGSVAGGGGSRGGGDRRGSGNGGRGGGDRDLERRSGVYWWILSRLTSEAEAECVLRDLDELAAYRRQSQGRIRAWLSHRIECLLYLWRIAFDVAARDRVHGGPTVVRGSGLSGIREDFHYAVRSIRRSPGFTLVAASILALCIGANAAIFSVVKGVLLDALPYPQPDRLTAVWMVETDVGRLMRMTPGNYSDVRGLDGVFQDLGAFASARATITTEDGEPEILVGASATASYFRTLGVRPVVGRTFRDSDEEPGAAAVVVLSHAVWTRRFGADPSIVGQLITLDGAAVEVLGVMPAAVYPMRATTVARIPFRSDAQDFWIPLRYPQELWSNRRPHVLGVVARLADGVSLDGARASLEGLGARLSVEDPLNAGETLTLSPFRDEVVGGVRTALFVLMGAVGLVLLIATTNVAGLLIVRTDARRREFAVRSAVGAGRARLQRQTMFESTILGLVGVAGGVVVAQVALSAIRSAVPFDIPRLSETGIDAMVLLVALVAGLLAALAFGFVPAIRASREQSTAFLGRLSRGLTLDGRRRRLHQWMVGTQAALVVIVTVAATLLVRSFRSLRSIDPGFSSVETLVLPMRADDATLEELRDRFAALPGVASVALAYDHPLQRTWGDSFLILGWTSADDSDMPGASLRPVGPGYFETVGTRVQRGREFTGFDRAGAPGAAVVNEALARRYFQDGRVIGERVVVPTAARMFGDGLPESYEIVGVVDNVRFLGLDGPAEPALYLPLAQFPAGGQLLVRPAAGADLAVQLVSSLRSATHELDPTLAFPVVQSLDENLRDLLARPRFNMMLLASFAMLGLLLCGLGIYSLTGRAVAARFREIGIRSALGARRLGLLGTVLGGTLLPVTLGAASGMIAAAAFSQVLRSLLFGVSPRDPLTFALTPLVVLLVGALGALIPAARALAINPTAALNSD